MWVVSVSWKKKSLLISIQAPIPWIGDNLSGHLLPVLVLCSLYICMVIQRKCDTYWILHVRIVFMLSKMRLRHMVQPIKDSGLGVLGISAVLASTTVKTWELMAKQVSV